MLDSKTEVMVSLGTAIGANCIPCFEHLYLKARDLNITADEIQHVVDIAVKVKNGASIFMKNTINQAMGETAETEQPCCSQPQSSCC